MELRVTPTPDQEAFIKDGIASGRFHNADEIAKVALQRWEEYERHRAELIAELHVANQSIDRGEGVSIETDEELDALFDRIKKDARSRLQSRETVAK